MKASDLVCLMVCYRFVAAALLLRQWQRWHKMRSRQQQHSQPACLSSFLSTYRERAGQGGGAGYGAANDTHALPPFRRR